MSPYPGEPWREFLIRALQQALVWGAVTIGGATYTAAEVRGMIVAHDASRAPEVRLAGLGGTVPTAPLPVNTIQFNQTGATGVTGETGPPRRSEEPPGSGPTGATGPD
jgi:hypothetical protein